MIVLSFGRWSHAAGFLFVRERIYFKGKWLPLCKIFIRYKKDQRWSNILYGLGFKK